MRWAHGQSLHFPGPFFPAWDPVMPLQNGKKDKPNGMVCRICAIVIWPTKTRSHIAILVWVQRQVRIHVLRFFHCHPRIQNNYLRGKLPPIAHPVPPSRGKVYVTGVCFLKRCCGSRLWLGCKWCKFLDIVGFLRGGGVQGEGVAGEP